MRARRVAGSLRRLGPTAVLVLVVLFAGVSAWQWWVVASHLRHQARETSRLYGRVTAALADPSPNAGTEALIAIVPDIRASGIPLIITDPTGRPTAAANLRLRSAELDDPRILAYIRQIDRTNPPIDLPGIGQLHYGALPEARLLTRLGGIQLAVLLAAIAVGVWAYRSAVTRDRDRVWVAMARESAHQLGTPLMSAGAWVDRLGEGATPPTEIAKHLRGDLDRLQRVAQRFERIGRPAKRERVALGAVAERVATYFQPRLPRHTTPITISVTAPSAGPFVKGDAVLIEWAVEALVRNAVDALSGGGGEIEIAVTDEADCAVLRVRDTGPGIPPDIRRKIFEPGVSSKTGGWGIGLALARRIVEGAHDGELDVEPSAEGTVFQASIPLTRDG
ncbi:MAG: HAMP domain-containing histidine kinase [Gemmatimonadota bacterium]|nr:HAMP domain-containing histidine kinase [Gemmatimonadota bacterium]MDH3366299.1 HAMP domain-containing histidine kinase [Gemmatimonadota bacterium]MDH3477039.1 HAMP domain-containing histidine kinase [Gemmatimonadota bacterium]MDH5549543.1 HAMP domain-containing histidine kinase [Gemmatimonadota bacterium]